jgi:hypothetical protein
MGIMFVLLVCGAMASRPDDFSHAVYVLAFSNAEALGRIADYRSDFVGRSRGRRQCTALDQPFQPYQRCSKTQNCRCDKYHRVGRHLCQKLDHLPLLGDLGSIGRSGL